MGVVESTSAVRSKGVDLLPSPLAPPDDETRISQGFVTLYWVRYSDSVLPT